MPRNTTAWQLAGPTTLRLASRKLLENKHSGFPGYGTNLQNPTETICRLYEPDAGKLFIQADQAGAEALITAYLCRAGKFRAIFLNKIKPHVFVGLHIFQKQFEKKLDKTLVEFVECPITDLAIKDGWKEVSNIIKDSDGWPARERYYFIAKQVCHSSNYDASANALRINTLQKSDGRIVLTKQEAERFLETYHSLFPEIREWHYETRNLIHECRELRNLFSFPRKFYGPLNESLYKEAYAWISQSTVGCITNIGFVWMQEYIEKHNKLQWDLLNNKHDSILMQAPIDEAMEAAKVLKSALEQSLTNFRGETFKMGAEVAIGKNWGKYHSEKNPDGMKEIKI